MTKLKKGLLLVVFVVAVLSLAIPEICANASPLIATAGARATENDVVKPTVENKKGIQGTEFLYGSRKDENPEALNINHVLINVDLAKIISTSERGMAYGYNGKTYYYNRSPVEQLQAQVKEFREEGKAITFVLLISWSDNSYLQNLIYPGGRERGHTYYAFNAEEAGAAETLSATFYFLNDVFGQSEFFVQNWIVGNEVNMPNEYNYTGTVDLSANVELCATTFGLFYEAMKDNNPYAKAYISLTNHWNEDDEGRGMKTKDFLDAFAAKVGDKEWNIAFHAYPVSQKPGETCWSKKIATWLRNDVSTRYVCGANLSILTDYVKNTYGNSHRIILSEQGFNYEQGADEQAAMLAYTYFAAAGNDMVDAAIFMSWEDGGTVETDGYYFGLVNNDGTKRPSYYVFKYMNTNQASAYADRYLSTIGITAWTDDMIYRAPATSAVMTSASLYLEENGNDDILIAYNAKATEDVDIEYKWTVVDSSGNSTVVCDWLLNYEVLRYKPLTNGRYEIIGEARIAGNTDSIIRLKKVVYYGVDVSATVDSATVEVISKKTDYMKLKAIASTSDNAELEYQWIYFDSTGEYTILNDYSVDNQILEWYPAVVDNYTMVCNVRVVGNENSSKQAVKNVFLKDLIVNPTDAEISDAGLVLVENSRDKLTLGLGVNKSAETDVDYMWEATDSNDNTTIIQEWTRNNEWLTWTPPKFGEYKIKGTARVAGNPTSIASAEKTCNYNPHIKGKCQMPYTGEGGGYLIGVESYENPNQTYRYEMLILDCTLLAEGKDAWVYTTGKFGVNEGNAGWTVWQPQYGYYWTLFRVYDADDNMIDEACYGFVNAY